MPKVTAATLAVTGLLLIALAGCAGEADSAGEESAAPVVSASATPEESAAPLVAETADPDSTDADRIFLEYVDAALQPDTQIADAADASLIDAGHQACEQILAGVPIEDVRVIEGETPNASGYYADSSNVRNAAQVAYCPETL